MGFGEKSGFFVGEGGGGVGIDHLQVFYGGHFLNWLFLEVYQNSRYFLGIVRIGIRSFCWTDSYFY